MYCHAAQIIENKCDITTTTKTSEAIKDPWTATECSDFLNWQFKWRLSKICYLYRLNFKIWEKIFMKEIFALVRDPEYT